MLLHRVTAAAHGAGSLGRRGKRSRNPIAAAFCFALLVGASCLCEGPEGSSVSRAATAVEHVVGTTERIGRSLDGSGTEEDRKGLRAALAELERHISSGHQLSLEYRWVETYLRLLQMWPSARPGWVGETRSIVLSFLARSDGLRDALWSDYVATLPAVLGDQELEQAVGVRAEANRGFRAGADTLAKRRALEKEFTDSLATSTCIAIDGPTQPFRRCAGEGAPLAQLVTRPRVAVLQPPQGEPISFAFDVGFDSQMSQVPGTLVVLVLDRTRRLAFVCVSCSDSRYMVLARGDLSFAVVYCIAESEDTARGLVDAITAWSWTQETPPAEGRSASGSAVGD